MKRIDGVGDVFLFGEQDYSMRIWVDPDQLAARGLTAMDVVAAVKEQNIQVAAGQLGQPPSSGKQPYEFTLTTLGRLVKPEQFENIILRTHAGRPRNQGSKTSATPRLRPRARTWTNTLDFHPSTSVAIFQLPDANALATADRIRAKMEELKKTLPARHGLLDRLRHHAVRRRVDRRGGQDADRGDHPRGASSCWSSCRAGARRSFR